MKSDPLSRAGKIGYSLVANIFGEGTKVLPAERLFLKLVLTSSGRLPNHNLRFYIDELISNDEMRAQHDTASSIYKTTKFSSFSHKVLSNPGLVALYYALVRELQPNSILETGTAWGSMTSFMLCALKVNGKGRLTSIDLSPVAGELTMNVDIKPEQVGLFIPESYRYLHKVIEGDAKQILPICITNENVDFFVHDSLHTSAHMAFEYRCALNLMNEGGVILTDDRVYFNDAFKRFCSEHNLKGYSPLENLNTGICLISRGAEEQQFSGPCRNKRYTFSEDKVGF